MCGITGYIGTRPAVEMALSNLKRLEYRGYDSSGVAFPGSGGIRVVRATGKIVNLERALETEEHQAHIAIAHTRWATHGRPTEANAHPHRDCTGRIAVVHNGIIENYAELRSELIANGHEFTSETDTEVIAHLIEQEIQGNMIVQETHTGGEALPAVAASSLHAPARHAHGVGLAEPGTGRSVADGIRAALKRVTGSYAVAVLSLDTPDTVFVARKDSPLVVGLGLGENFIASDIPAVMRYTRSVLLLEDGDFATITPDAVVVTDLNGLSLERTPLEVTWDDEAAEKGGFPHFMLKEIHEGPRTVRNTLRGRLTDSGQRRHSASRRARSSS